MCLGVDLGVVGLGFSSLGVLVYWFARIRKFRDPHLCFVFAFITLLQSSNFEVTLQISTLILQ